MRDFGEYLRAYWAYVLANLGENFSGRGAFLPLLPAWPARNRVFLAILDRLPRLDRCHVGYALSRRLSNIDCITDPPTTDHVAALPVVGIRMHKIVCDFFQNFLEARA